jgi:hypothetical protein
MSKKSGVLSASGCGASITGQSWNDDGTRLSFNLNVPKDPQGDTITLRIDNEQATARPGGSPNHRLDGNQDPPDASGHEKNRDDYVWHVSCVTGVVTARYFGTMDSTYFVDFGNGNTNTRTAHFVWDEKVSRRIIDNSLVGTPTLTVSGSVTSTYPQSPGADCAGTLSATLANSPINLAVETGIPPGSIPDPTITASAQLPANSYYGVESTGSGDCAMQPALPPDFCMSTADCSGPLRLVTYPGTHHISDLPYNESFSDSESDSDQTNTISSTFQVHLGS